MSQRLPNVLLEQRLARDSVIDPEARCILWMASRNASGYGQVRWQGPAVAHPPRRLAG